MGLFGFLFKSPLGIIISLFSGVIGIVVIAGVGISALALTGGPAPCTPGGGTIEISDAQASSFDAKWDQLDAALNGGGPSSISLSESEISSRANKYIDDKGGDVDNVRVCVHDGYGEVTGSVDVAVGNGDFRVKGAVALSGGRPVVDFQDVELGNVPGFALAPFENAVEDAIQELLDDITLDHTYTPTLTEGKAEVSGTP
ncbi:MAG TPA: hypothetical protein VGR43_08835 [Dehalococcoidia bacterium]|jgi:hypothetical protein|nr:hypothetical protein [Dehalococcoidia bacterium]